jgi:hypothetical protein
MDGSQSLVKQKQHMLTQAARNHSQCQLASLQFIVNCGAVVVVVEHTLVGHLVVQAVVVGTRVVSSQ